MKSNPNHFLVVSILSVFLVLTLSNCSSDTETEDPPIEEPQNQSPQNFNLISISDNSTNVDFLPSFSWEEAIDPDGDPINYDFILDSSDNPMTKLFENLSETSTTLQNPLLFNTSYFWKVIAKDSKGGLNESAVFNFSTRNINLNQSPVNPGFEERDFFQTMAFDNKLWIIGGSGVGIGTLPVRNDIWSSVDGINWIEVTNSANFSKRGGHTSAVYNGKLWVIGGLVGSTSLNNDVWSSSDGLVWTEVANNSNFTERFFHSTVVFNDKIWIIGGSSLNGLLNDSWYSSDGINWIEATNDAGFSPRSGHSTIVFDNKIWVIGGSSTNGLLNDIWYSSDGINWTEVPNDRPFSPRIGHATGILYNKLWMLGGNGDNGRLKDIWFSENGIEWTEVTIESEFSERTTHTMTFFDNKLWIIGGSTDAGVKTNEVWYME